MFVIGVWEIMLGLESWVEGDVGVWWFVLFWCSVNKVVLVLVVEDVYVGMFGLVCLELFVLFGIGVGLLGLEGGELFL